MQWMIFLPRCCSNIFPHSEMIAPYGIWTQVRSFFFRWFSLLWLWLLYSLRNTACRQRPQSSSESLDFLELDLGGFSCPVNFTRLLRARLRPLGLLWGVLQPIVLCKGKPLYSATSHKVENQWKKTEGVRFNSLTVQNISGKRKMGRISGKIPQGAYSKMVHRAKREHTR